MYRREFIEKSVVISTAACLPRHYFSGSLQPRFKMGYQLFSVRDAMADNPIATLRALKEMGYQDFETYGYDNEKDQFYGFASNEFKTILDELQLTVSSGHYGFSPFLQKSDDDMIRFVDQCIAGADVLDSKYITWPWIAPEQRTIENFKVMTGKLNLAGERITDAGLGFAYHNHGFEFDDHQGECGFDIILRETDPAVVKLQLDMYWVMHSAKHTPKEFVANQPGRYVMWHIKDMDKVTRDYTELGNGSIDYTTLLPDPEVAGLAYYYIEQGGNFSENSMQSAAESARFFKEHLQRFL